MSPVEEMTDSRRWAAFAAAATSLFLTLVDFSIVNVALPSIATDTGASTASLQWVISGYALALGMVPIIAGRLGDDIGRRRMLLIGIAGFVVTSAASGLAPTPGVLIAARVLQGLAGGILNPQVSGLVQQLFGIAERGKAFGVIGAMVGTATAGGPVVGGVIIALGGTHLGWRLNFLINVPIGIASFVLCWRLLPRTRPAGRRRRLDLPGAGLLTLGIGSVLFPAVQYDAHHDARLALALIPAAAFLVALALWERGPARRRGHPLINTTLLRVSSYASGLGTALAYFTGYSGLPLVLTLFLQLGLHYSALHAGLTASAFAIGVTVSAPIGGSLVSRLGRRLLVGALTIFCVGVVGAIVVGGTLPGSVGTTVVGLILLGPLFVAGLGGGSVITPNQALSLQEVDPIEGSTAGGMLQTAQRIGAALGAALCSAVFYAVVSAAASGGRARAREFGHGFAAALGLTVVLSLVALGLSLRATRRVAQPGASAGG